MLEFQNLYFSGIFYKGEQGEDICFCQFSVTTVYTFLLLGL